MIDRYKHRLTAIVQQLAVVGFGAILAMQAGCDTSLDPFDQGEHYFSIFGYLDAGADTQFVRISPLRDSVSLPPAPVDASVSLTHEATGRIIVLHDSLFEYSDGQYGANFWTSERLEPRASYTLTVTRSDGAASTVSVTLPDTVSDPVLIVPMPAPFQDPNTLFQSIRMNGVERVADVKITYRLTFPGQPPGSSSRFYSISYLAIVDETTSGFQVAFRAYSDLREAVEGNCPIVVEAKAFVASAGPDWPDLDGIDLETLARPDVVTNITNGVGYLGSIASITIDWPELRDFMNGLQASCVNRQ